ncbi:eukaryotic translation initiation factor 4E transporter isoform X2 [Bombus terrestris]|uniref:Eukaryotic translation initiation factor 4E transporter isoform X2 n=1 Tax=Bombus terrestris TaxID=30195 RepID=A0A9C6SMX2_BOMTE|nr:eukaryotic translation initiation factor 4E transporter isoform X2 [Bombus terrestris]
MKLDNTRGVTVISNWYRRPRKRPLVGPTGSPLLDVTLAMQTRPFRWSRKNKSANITKRVTFRDEAIISMSVAGKVTDTSIMEVGRSRPQFQYSREELMLIKNLPLSKRRPDVLDTSYNNSRGAWDPELWHSDSKRSDTPPKDERTGHGDQVTESHNKRRNGDPRERIRKEQDGIVLSPQRRSFNSGCFVNVNQPSNRRPESPIGKTEVSHREPVRRIGSGRILTRDIWDFRPENEKLEPAFRSGASGGTSMRDRDNRDTRDGKDRENARERDRDRDNLRERDERNERFERRSFGRDYSDRDRERDRDRAAERNDRNHQSERDKDRGRERRFSNDRRRTYSENRCDADEPEWFSSGPTSQHDTIELRGFEDIPEEKAVNNSNSNTKNKKQTPVQKKRGKKNSLEKDGKQTENSAGPKGRSTPTAMDQPINVVPAPHSPISEQNESTSLAQKPNHDSNESAVTEQSCETTDSSSTANQNQENSHPDFNLDEFLKSDTFPGVPGLLTNGVGSNGGSCSRFSQWFKRESPVQQVDSRRTSIQDDILNNLLNDITEPNIQIPSVTESNTYFAPISPANTTATNNTTSTTGVKLLEMLQRGNKPSQNGQGDAVSTVIPMMKSSSIKDMVGGKVVHSLEELEARMRGGAPPPTSSTDQPRVNKTEEDLSAFKKLLAQVTGGQAIPAANGPISQKQPVTLIQLLNSQLKTQPIAPQQSVPEPMHATTFNHAGSVGPTQHPHQAQMQHENLMKVLQIQQQQQKQQQQQQQQHSDMLSMMMGGQRMLGMSPVPPEMQMMLSNAPTSQELLQRPEAQAIIQGLQQGEITRQHLIQQLQNPAMQHRHREVLVNILKMYGGTTPRTISPHPSAPTPQDHILQQMLYQQQQQRIPSPMNNAYCPPSIISPNLTASPSTLTVQHPVMQHRVPSPREIVMHAQSIMQSALIKKKLEEQRENFRKRQDQQQQQQQQQAQQRASSPVNSPAKQTMSPTPLAFTPTSVLRKMTADKEPEGNSSDPSKMTAQSQTSQMQQMQSAVQLLTQGVLCRQNTLRPQSVQSTWSNPTIKQHPGRPIVKGGSGGGNGSNQFQYSANSDFQQQQQQQQQHRTVSSVYGNPARSKHTMTSSIPHHNVPQYNVAQNSMINQRSNSMNNQMKVQQAPSHLANMQHQPPQQQQRILNSQMQMVLNQNYNSNRADGRVMRSQQLNMPVGRQASPGLGYVGSNGGDLSPTSNQLARWFSPELLAQARAGKLPELVQTNVLSLEELERLQHASTTVHN